MKVVAGVVVVAAVLATQSHWLAPLPVHDTRTAVAPVHAAPPALTPAELTGIVQRYCVVCHNDRLLTGNMSLQDLDVANPLAKAPLAEKMIQKLRAGMMPPPG